MHHAIILSHTFPFQTTDLQYSALVNYRNFKVHMILSIKPIENFIQLHIFSTSCDTLYSCHLTHLRKRSVS